MSNPEITAELFEDRGYSEAEYKELEQMYARTLGSINAGEIVKGRIVHIGDNEVAVDIGFKSEGTVPVSEFTNLKDLKIGDEVEVFLESMEESLNRLKQVKFSKENAYAARKAESLSTCSGWMRSCPDHKLMSVRFEISMHSSDAKWIFESSR